MFKTKACGILQIKEGSEAKRRFPMYLAKETRYDTMKYNRYGKSGLLLPAVSLGLWHNFGSNGKFDNMMDLCLTAFDHGIAGTQASTSP